MNSDYHMSAEAVSEGHPDKLADQISDAVLDSYLKADPYARVACETLLSGNFAVVAGEITATKNPAETIPEIVRRVIAEVGYDNLSYGFDLDQLDVLQRIHNQSEEIAHVVGGMNGELGAGDQGIMFGYATDETPEYMPLPVCLARGIIQKATVLRHGKILDWLRPDAKSQVTVSYSKNSPVRVETVILSSQHAPGVPAKELRRILIEQVILPVLSQYQLAPPAEILVNPAGPFTQGGPGSDTGLTGRKIVVDSYGPFCPVGGGAFSGKDPTKVDRSGAYMARYIAKNIVAAGLAQRCSVQIAYAIGRPKPVSLSIDTDGTGNIPDEILARFVGQWFDLTPSAIIKVLDLRLPRYLECARIGHFGFNCGERPWEVLDRLEIWHRVIDAYPEAAVDPEPDFAALPNTSVDLHSIGMCNSSDEEQEHSPLFCLEDLFCVEEILGLWDVKYPGPDGMIIDSYSERLELKRDGTYIWNPSPSWAPKNGVWGVRKTPDGSLVLCFEENNAFTLRCNYLVIISLPFKEGISIFLNWQRTHGDAVVFDDRIFRADRPTPHE